MFGTNGVTVVSNNIGNSTGNTQENGIIVDPINNLSAQRVTITGNTIHNNSYNGVAVYNDNGSIAGVSISANAITNGGRYGVFIEEKSGGTINEIAVDVSNCFADNAFGTLSDSRSWRALPLPPTVSSCSSGIISVPWGVKFITSRTDGTLRNDHTGWAGMKITVGPKPLYVTQLGRCMAAGNVNPHALKIVQVSSGTDLPGALASVTTTGQVDDNCAYAKLPTVVTLSAYTSYYIVTQETYGGDQFYDVDMRLRFNASVASIDSGAYQSANERGWHTFGASNHGYGAVDFVYSLTAPGGTTTN